MICSWKRPDGPLKIYDTFEIFETLNDGSKKKVRVRIQEVPDEERRRNEVIDHVTKYYLKDEPIAESFAKDGQLNPDFIEDYKCMWKYCLKQEISVAAYTLDSDDNIKELAGVNLLFAKTPETKKDCQVIKSKIKSEEFRKTSKLCEEMCGAVDMFKIYDVDQYLTSFSLSVHPKFRGQKLGMHLLKTRDKVGPNYGLSATSTIFTAAQSQTQAKRAGFDERLSIDFSKILDENGAKIFPGIKSKRAVVMTKKLG